MGANVLVVFLRRYGDAAKMTFNVVLGADACVTFDVKACQLELEHGWNGYAYSRHVIRSIMPMMGIKFEEVQVTWLNWIVQFAQTCHQYMT